MYYIHYYITIHIIIYITIYIYYYICIYYICIYYVYRRETTNDPTTEIKVQNHLQHVQNNVGQSERVSTTVNSQEDDHRKT